MRLNAKKSLCKIVYIDDVEERKTAKCYQQLSPRAEGMGDIYPLHVLFMISQVSHNKYVYYNREGRGGRSPKKK